MRYASYVWVPDKSTLTPGGGISFTAETGHYVRIFLDIDTERMANVLGLRALHSKSGKASLMHGAIKVSMEKAK
jgi:hypothetical protein